MIAMTGVAADLIGGSTLHRFMGVGINKTVKDLASCLAKIKASAALSKRWKGLKVLLIDESKFG
jgi:hypothetical protein